MVEDASHWMGHILVCTRSYDIFEFVCTLRSALLTTEEYKHILLLCQERPSESALEFLLQFPGMYFILGDSRKKSDLYKAGVEGADKIVIMNLGNSINSQDPESSEYSDSNTMQVNFYIFIFLTFYNF